MKVMRRERKKCKEINGNERKKRGSRRERERKRRVIDEDEEGKERDKGIFEDERGGRKEGGRDIV